MRFNKELKERSVETNIEIENIVRDIIADVRLNGDTALRKYNEKFDKYTGDFVIKPEVIEEENFMRILERAKKQITEFHINQLNQGFELKKENGVIMGQFARPIKRVAVYVPGGKASYPSSVLMNVLPAQIAGVKEIAVFTPDPSNEVLMACKVCGIDSIYKIGGAQAIAAAAYGTESIKKFDKIVGPGNIFVATAKKQVVGEVDIDMIAGPSEVLVIADEYANPAYIAADLMSQAEHDEMAKAILITTSQKVIDETEKEIDKQIQTLSRKAIIEKSLKDYSTALLVNNIEEAIDLSNEIAPEHLELLVEDPFKYLDLIDNAGSVFLGENSPEPLGDYMSGTNHVLPTSGTAKFYSPLGVYDFIKVSCYSYYPKDVLETFKDDVIEFANREGLDAHANSLKVRF